jgi:hypothetical protein
MPETNPDRAYAEELRRSDKLRKVAAGEFVQAKAEALAKVAEDAAEAVSVALGDADRAPAVVR